MSGLCPRCCALLLPGEPCPCAAPPGAADALVLAVALVLLAALALLAPEGALLGTKDPPVDSAADMAAGPSSPTRNEGDPPVSNHSKSLYPALALAEGADPAIGAPRPRALTASDQRERGRTLALGWWLAAGQGVGSAEIARAWGVSRQQVERVGAGDRVLALGDVVMAPPEVAAPVLRAALARVEQRAEHLRASQLVAEAMRAAGAALQVAQTLSAAPLAQMPRAVLERTARMVREVQTRLGLVLVRIEAELESRPPEEPASVERQGGERRVG